MNKEDLKKLSESELNKELMQLKKELFDLKFGLENGEVKDLSQFGKIRKDTARCLTFLKQKQA
ncbi:50S ribosomal protein L29 [Candidatus Dependentiae bacterium]|nr:50S ribosomal protein L29 [Candidatus Dependentiae bacterium]MBU4387587.1 50S ribosomal protein L29 [Candidatus Dependentiae bacterium]MCG2756291.1 50S ribosomal protein L29 [Candidatus Dependentiae bacterium]